MPESFAKSVAYLSEFYSSQILLFANVSLFYSVVFRAQIVQYMVSFIAQWYICLSPGAITLHWFETAASLCHKSGPVSSSFAAFLVSHPHRTVSQRNRWYTTPVVRQLLRNNFPPKLARFSGYYGTNEYRYYFDVPAITYLLLNDFRWRQKLLGLVSFFWLF